jgi:hypothetical protein
MEHMERIPYWMTTLELQEVHMQLKELLDLVLIIPSVSSWGASIIFGKKKDGRGSFVLTIIN